MPAPLATQAGCLSDRSPSSSRCFACRQLCRQPSRPLPQRVPPGRSWAAGAPIGAARRSASAPVRACRSARPGRRPGVVGSGTGAVARQDLAWLYPGFPPSCPVNRVRGSVSSSRHLARSMKISFTTRSCTLHDKVYETYPIGVAFDDSSEAVTQIQVSALAIDYSTASDRGLGLTPSPFSLPLAV